MFLNIQIDFLILKTYYGQFTLTTKKSLHIIFKGDMQQFFLQNWLKVVSSFLMQYKLVCVTNFDKLCRKMLKRTSLLVFLV